MWLGSVAAPLNSVNTVAGPCPPLVLPLNSVNSVAGLCGWALSCPPLGRRPELCLGSVAVGLLLAPELCQLCGWALWLGLHGNRAYPQPRRFDGTKAEIEPRWTLHQD